jgi:protein-tyrosine phosphatase
VLERARAGERVDVGCFEGHGRTGTALACLAILTGHRLGPRSLLCRCRRNRRTRSVRGRI